MNDDKKGKFLQNLVNPHSRNKANKPSEISNFTTIKLNKSINLAVKANLEKAVKVKNLDIEPYLANKTKSLNKKTKMKSELNTKLLPNDNLSRYIANSGKNKKNAKGKYNNKSNYICFYIAHDYKEATYNENSFNHSFNKQINYIEKVKLYPTTTTHKLKQNIYRSFNAKKRNYSQCNSKELIISF